MLELIDYIQQYATKQEPSLLFRETRFGYNELSGQWTSENEDSAPVMLLTQWVQANTVGSNTTTTLVLQWLYTQIGDNAARSFQQQALHNLSQIVDYLGGENTDLPLYQIAGATYTLVDTDTPFICAGATLNLTLTAKDFTFTCCDLPEPVEDPLPVCEQDCPLFSLPFSEATAFELGITAPTVLPVSGDQLAIAFTTTYEITDPSDIQALQAVYYVDANGQTDFALPTLVSPVPFAFYFVLPITTDLETGTLWVKFEDCDYIKIAIPQA